MVDVVDELKLIAALKVGDPIPEQLGPVTWAETISKLCGNAANEILRLRAEIVAIRQMVGCVEVPLKTFADIKKDLKHG